MSDTAHAHEHAEHHLPPNSFVPICFALTMAATFVGFLIGWYVWVPALVLFIATLVVWARNARTEYLDLPD